MQGDVTQSKYRVGGVYQRTDDGAGNRLHSILVKAGDAIIAEVQLTDDGKGNVGSPNLYSVRTDRLGSTTVVRDPSGKYTHRYYDAFGIATDESGTPSAASPLSSAVGFAGYVQDDDQSLLWMNNRPYDAHIGRALSLDPIINGGAGQDGANRYAYVYNRPTTMVDPSGFCAINIYIPYWGYTCGGGGSGGGTSNPVQLVNPGGKTGYLMTMTMAPDVGVPPGQFSDPVVASTSGQITELIDVDDQAGTSSDAASATAAGGDGNGDGTSPSSQAPWERSYATPEQAARSALMYYNPMSILSQDPNDPLSTGVELGGLIYEMDGRYYFTEAIVDPEMTGHVYVWDAIYLVPEEAQSSVVGDYHTHGGLNEYFDGEEFSGSHSAGPAETPSVRAQSDIGEGAADLSDHNGNIANPRNYTEFLGTPSGGFGAYNPYYSSVIIFSPDSRFLPGGTNVPAAGYSWH